MSACRLCGARVESAYMGYVRRWECSDCGLVYAKEPPKLETVWSGYGPIQESCIESRVATVERCVDELARK